MIDWMTDNLDTLFVTAATAISVGWAVVQWVYSYVDTRISRNSDATEANAEEITGLRMRTARHDNQIDGLRKHMGRLRDQSSQEHKELWQAVSKLPTKSDMDSMKADVREIREILIQRNGKP